MSKDAYINVRVDKRVKCEAQKVLAKVGLSTTEAVNLLLHQIVLRKGLPFDVCVPNQKTQAAIRQARAGKAKRQAGSTVEILRD